MATPSGAELLARQLEGTWRSRSPAGVTNGSIYIELAN